MFFHSKIRGKGVYLKPHNEDGVCICLGVRGPGAYMADLIWSVSKGRVDCAQADCGSSQ